MFAEMSTDRALMRRRIIFPTLHAKLSQRPRVRHEQKCQLSTSKTKETPPTSPELSPQQQANTTLHPSTIPFIPSLELPSISNLPDSGICNSHSFSSIAKDMVACKSFDVHLESLRMVKSSPRKTQTSIIRKLSESRPVQFIPKHSVSFDPKVWVIEFQEGLPKEDKWFNRGELCRFRYEAALCRIQKNILRNENKLLDQHLVDICGVPNRLQRTGNKPLRFLLKGITKDIFSSGITSQEDDEEIDINVSKEKILHRNDQLVKKHLLLEVKSVLIVDPSEMFLGLFVKGIRNLLGDPHVKIVTASSGIEALDALRNDGTVDDSGATQGVDLIVVEEQLTRTRRIEREGVDRQHAHHCEEPKSDSLRGHNARIECAVDEHLYQSKFSSGSGLIRHLSRRTSVTDRSSRLPFIVGVTAHLEEHEGRIRGAGADMVWGKPPPKMDKDLRLHLLSAILEKKRHHCEAY